MTYLGYHLEAVLHLLLVLLFEVDDSVDVDRLFRVIAMLRVDVHCLFGCLHLAISTNVFERPIVLDRH